MAAASTYGCRFQIKMESTKEREREKERQKTDKDKTRHKTSKRRKESTHLPTQDSLRVVVACRLSESHVFPPLGYLVLGLVAFGQKGSKQMSTFWDSVLVMLIPELWHHLLLSSWHAELLTPPRSHDNHHEAVEWAIGRIFCESFRVEGDPGSCLG